MKNIKSKILYINGILPTPTYLLKYKILKQITKCTDCNVIMTDKHIFEECIYQYGIRKLKNTNTKHKSKHSNN